MNMIYALIISLMAGLSTILGSIFIFIPVQEENIKKFLSFSLAFSIAVMICISIFDLIPESFIKIMNILDYKGIFIILLLFLLSYVIIKYISLFLDKLENNNLYKLGILSMITLIMHNLPEGILTFLTSISNINLGLKISFAIALHNIPEDCIKYASQKI